MTDREDSTRPEGGRRLSGVHGAALVTASASLIFEVWAGWQGEAWRLRMQGKLVESLSLGFLTLTFILLGGDAVRARRLVRRLQRAAVEQSREVAELREATISAGATPVTGELPLLTFALDAHGRFERFNPRWLEMLGGSESDLSRQRFADLLPADQLGVWRDLETAILAGSPVPRFQISLLDRNGRRVFLEGSAWPRKLTDHPSIAGSLVDVTPHRQAESARAEAEASFRNLFLRNPAATYLSTADGRLLDCNESFVRLLGFANREEALATPTYALYSITEDRNKLIAALRQAGNLDNVETKLRRRNGDIVTVLQSIAWKRDAGGVETMEGIALDITPRLEAESALRRSEARLRALLSLAPVGIAETTAEGDYVYVNTAWCQMSGLAPAEARGKGWLDAVPAGERERVAAEWATAAAQGIRHHCEHGFQRRDEQVWVAVDSTPLYNDREMLIGHIRVVADVTERKRAVEALRDSEARFRNIFENGLGFVCTHDLDGRLLSVNPAAAGALGFTAGELAGRNLSELLAPAVRGGFPAYLESLRQGRSVDGQMRLLTRAGEERVWIYRNAVHSPLNGPPYVLGFAFDVTEPRQARRMMEEQRRAFLDRIQRQNLELELHHQEAVRANRLKSEFLATMSHELRTPLNAIVGFSELLADDPDHPLSDKQGIHLQFVRTAAEHLLRLINDILDLSKIEAGRLKLSPENLRLAALLPEVLSTLGPLVAQKRIRLDQRVADDLSVFADRLHLKQILFNLLSNAVKFTPAGGIITIAAALEPGVSLLSVANTGSVIDPAEQELIFDEFQQARGGAETREGTGLGLAIVRRLVEQNEGKVWVESSAATGTELVVLLPDRQGFAAAAPSNPSSLPRAQRATGEPAILIVSQDEVASQRWSEALRRQRFSVRAVGCDAETLPLVQRSEPQLTILDLASTGAAGKQLLRELQRESGFDPLILALVADLPSRRPAFLAGAQGCLNLPLDDKLLVEACRRRIEPLDPPRVVLIVESNPERQRLLTEATIAAGFRPVVAASGMNSLQTAAQIHPHAVVMDLQLPGLDGYQTIVSLRSNPATANIPVLVLARKGDDAIETQVFSGPTRLLWLPDDDWRDFVTLEIQRTVDAERWLLPAAG